MDNARNDIELLYKNYYAKVNMYIRRKTGNAEAAEDLTQEVFEYCFKRYELFDSAKSSLSTWLFLIVNSRIKNYFRNRRDNESLEIYEDILSADNDMDAAVYLEQLKSVLMKAINELPENQRRVVLWKYFEGMSHIEIAEKLGISVGNSRVLLTRAMGKMREQLQTFDC